MCYWFPGALTLLVFSRGGDLNQTLGGGAVWLVGNTLMAHSAPQYKSDQSLKFLAISKTTVFGGTRQRQREAEDETIKQSGAIHAKAGAAERTQKINVYPEKVNR